MNGKCNYIILFAVWGAFIAINGYYFFCYPKYIKGMQIRVHADNYYTADSVWSPEESKWHDDTILYTLFKVKTVYINPNSWYAAYVEAFADNVVWDESVEIAVKTEFVGQDIYTRMNHMGLLSHSTLFKEKEWDVLALNAERLYLFIEEESVYASDDVIFFHDESGNIYLKGVDSEK